MWIIIINSNNMLSVLLASLNHIVILYISMKIIIIVIFILLQYNMKWVFLYYLMLVIDVSYREKGDCITIYI